VTDPWVPAEIRRALEAHPAVLAIEETTEQPRRALSAALY